MQDYFIELNFKFVRIAGARSSVFASLRLCYVKYLNMLCKCTVWVLLYLYRARNKITQLSIPTHAQLRRHRLKFNKNLLKAG